MWVGVQGSRIIRRCGIFLVHLVAGTYGSMAAAAALVYLLFPYVRLLRTGLEFKEFNRVLSVPYFPLQILVGLAIGYFLQRRFPSTAAQWVWVFPLVTLSYRFISFHPSVLEPAFVSRASHFFGRKCRPPDCFEQFRYTAPFYTAVAYSLAARLSASCPTQLRLSLRKRGD